MTVNPDEGMQLLAQRMSADRSVRQSHIPSGESGAGADGVGAEAGPGLELSAVVGVTARAAASMEGLTAELKRARQHAWENVHPIEIPGSGTNVAGSQTAAGTYYDDRWGPQEGWVWRIVGWSQFLGSGATSYSIFYDNPNDPTNEILTSSSSGRWEPSHFYLMPMRNICFTSVGGPLLVAKGTAIEIALDYLPFYLGFKG